MLLDYLVYPNLFAIDAFDGPQFTPEWRESFDYPKFITSLGDLLSRGHEKDGVTRWFKGLLGMKPYREQQLHVADRLPSDKLRRRVVYTPQVSSLQYTGFTPEQISSGDVTSLFDTGYGFTALHEKHAILISGFQGHSKPANDTMHKLTALEMSPNIEAQYINLLVEWLSHNNMTDIFWSLDPEASGIQREDWRTLATCRLNLIERLSPQATMFHHINSYETCVIMNPKRSENDPKRSENEPKRSENEPRSSENDPKRSENDPKRSENEPKGSGLLDYTGLDCMVSENSGRCIRCDGVSDDVLQPPVAQCLPKVLHEQLQECDDLDTKLQIVTKRQAKLAMESGVAGIDVDALHDELDNLRILSISVNRGVKKFIQHMNVPTGGWGISGASQRKTIELQVSALMDTYRHDLSIVIDTQRNLEEKWRRRGRLREEL